jgi:beta-glucanase (GH16 family)
MKTCTNRIAFVAVVLTSLLVLLSGHAYGAWTLVWSDEFSSSTINTANWTFDIGTGSSGWGNNELEYYTSRSQNARIENGNLIIQALKESYGGMSYTSARLKTQGLKSWTYGKVEARIKIPTGQGIWPAFWMLGNNISSVSWPACGEIDIMEHINTESVIHGTMHWDYNGYANYGTTSPSLDFSQYHVYTIEWNSSAIKWFVDGTQYLEGNIANSINGTDEFHRPFFILLNLAVGGNWPGSPNSSTVFPATMYVDYVRVYQDSGGGSSLAKTWYLFNTTVSGVSPAGQNLQSTKSGTTGWQPIKTISTTSSYWYSPTMTGTISSGTWYFYLWSNSPGSSSNVRVDVYRVSSSGGSATLIGSQTKDVNASGTGNHQTTYSFSGSSVSLSGQRLMVKITKSSGANATIAYNSNDFPTRLVTP